MTSSPCWPPFPRRSPSSRDTPRPAWRTCSAGSSTPASRPSPSCCARWSCRTCAGVTSTPPAAWPPGCGRRRPATRSWRWSRSTCSGIGAFWAGDFEAARRHFETVDRRFDPARRAEHLLRFGHDPRPVCVSRLANTLLFLGDYEEVFPTADRAVAMAEELGHPFTAGVVSVFAALLAVDMDDTHGSAAISNPCRTPPASRPWAWQPKRSRVSPTSSSARPTPASGASGAPSNMSSVDHAPGQQATHLHLLVAAHEVARDAAGGLARSGRGPGCPRYPYLGRRPPPGSQELPVPGRGTVGGTPAERLVADAAGDGL